MKIPFKIPQQIIADGVLSASTQEFLPVADISNNLVLLKNGGAAIILESSSLNFGLLSEREQVGVISSYAALLNSLSFPIQIHIRSQKKDIGKYIDYLYSAQQKITNPKLKAFMDNYIKFIKETVKKKNVLGKSFYIILPLSPLELGVAKSFKVSVQSGYKLPYPKSYILNKAGTILGPRRDHVVRQGARLGLTIKQLNNDAILNLLYKTFNPEMPPVFKKEGELSE